MITLYGIPNCDTVKKARAWLKSHPQPHEFHDFKKQGLPPEKLAGWTQALGWEKLLNRKGTTWRQLDAATQASVQDDASARAVMLAWPSLVKRPVVDWGDGLSVGFDAGAWAERLAST